MWRFPFSQEYLDDIYEAINEMGNPKLLEALESFVATTSDTLSQKNRENERLDTALRRQVACLVNCPANISQVLLLC